MGSWRERTQGQFKWGMMFCRQPQQAKQAGFLWDFVFG